jgi:hypothetical protein
MEPAPTIAELPFGCPGAWCPGSEQSDTANCGLGFASSGSPAAFHFDFVRSRWHRPLALHLERVLWRAGQDVNRPLLVVARLFCRTDQRLSQVRDSRLLVSGIERNSALSGSEGAQMILKILELEGSR